MNKAVRAACWTVPSVFCVWLYWYGLKAWFQQDDFAWLSLHNHVFGWRTLLTEMFLPMAQGTVRPWSERGFFLLFYRLFGADALPYRILVFATEIANLLLLSWIVLRLTASRAASFAAPVLWAANSSLVTAMAWTSDYNEVLCAFFLLSAFTLYLRGRYWLQVAMFVLGFGALELNVVYPALVLAYVITCQRSRERILRTLPLFAISLSYYALHRWAAPMPAGGPYALHVDWQIFQTFSSYWRWAFVPETWTRSPWQPLWLTLAFTVLLLWHITRQTRRRNFLPLFFVSWFLITLAPLLPLRDHMAGYYLTVPTIGLAMLLAEMLIGHGWARAAVLAPVFVYLYIQIPVARLGARWYFDRSQEVRELVLGIGHAHELHPGKAILLTDVTPSLYDFALAHSPFQALNIPEVYVADGPPGEAGRMVLPPGPAMRGVLDHEIVVYSVGSGRPRNITAAYERSAEASSTKEFPRKVDIGSRFLTYLLGSTWYPLEVDHRWMPQRASLRIGGPRSAGDRLIVTGYCPQEQIGSVPLRLIISVNGKVLPAAEFFKPEAPFTRIFSLPPDLAGSEYVDVTLEVSRTFTDPGGGRPLSLAFGVIEIRSS